MECIAVRSFLKKAVLLPALLGWVFVLCPTVAFAEFNSATGGIGGINNGTLAGGDGTGSARIEINSARLALVKQARDLTGIVLPDGAVVSSGQTIYFVLYIDNTTDFPAESIRLSDAIDETQFTYDPNSLETTTVPSGSGDSAIWSGTWTPLSDAVGGPDDEASVTDSGGPPDKDRLSVGALPGQTNQVLTIAGKSLRAIRFRVTVN